MLTKHIGHATFIVKGTRREMPYFVASFPYSNVGLAQVFPGENAECVCQGLRNSSSSAASPPGC